MTCRWLGGGGSKEALQKILAHFNIGLGERNVALSDGAVIPEVAFFVSDRVGAA
jgi:hypothetical protein